MSLLRLAYNLVFPLVFLGLLPGFLWRMCKRGKYRHKFGQRFAIYSKRVRLRIASRPRTWVHAVSVGEVLIAMKLIRRLRERDPARAFVLSTTTSTGFSLASEQRCDWLEPIYNPLDFPGIVDRAIGIVKPDQLILIEAEVWPNLVAGMRSRGASVILANARLSPRSFSRYSRVRPITRILFNQLDAVCVQEPEDADRWRSLGVESSKIRVTGSIKFDDATSAQPATRDFRPLLDGIGVPQDSPIFLGGSTHKGEEVILARACRRIRGAVPDLFFVSVPRHFERCPEVKSELEGLGLRVALRSQIAGTRERPDVLLVDSTGELRDWYRCATVVFVGKSLASTGGQNPAEPAALGKAVIVGPHMENFAALVNALLSHDGIVQSQNEESVEADLLRLLNDPARREELAANARKVIEIHRGATDRTCDVVEELKARSTGAS